MYIVQFTLTRNSFSGCGISKPLIVVVIGPSVPATTILSPSFTFPLTRITSIVVPRPWIALTSITVACKQYNKNLYVTFHMMKKW